ncbi:hypothetical protein V1514DRAFT_129622 [Lipomyces japonicus]|uniref:uncharacterized protein n=1 Tax=Lipomyces japonicus TaxID=56871 RepID=UPI0034CD8DFD
MKAITAVHFFLRLVQLFVGGIILGDYSYEVYNLRKADSGLSVPSVYIFTLSICSGSLVSVIFSIFISKAGINPWYLCIWDATLGLLSIVGFVWTILDMSPFYCAWNAFNPFTKNSCGRMRAAIIFLLING